MSGPAADKREDLKEALDNLKEAVEIFCAAYSEAHAAVCPLAAGHGLSLEHLERGLQEEPGVLSRAGLAGERARLRRAWVERVKIPRRRGEVEISLSGHHGQGVLARFAARLAETSGHYVARISSRRFEPARRRLIMPQAGGRIVIVTGDDAGFALELQTTAREDWQTGAIASYLKMANPALLGDFTIA